MMRWLVQSKLWVAFGAAALCAETYWMCGEWIRLVMVAHVFFMTWTAYLFIDDEPIPLRKKWAPLALTGVLVTFQGFEYVYLELACGALVLLYRMHWIPRNSRENRWELRKLPLINNLVITLCWILLCEVLPLVAMGKSTLDYPLFLVSNALWIFALSMSEDCFHNDSTHDATLRFLGRALHRILAVLFVIVSACLHAIIHSPSIGVWLSLTATLAFLIVIPYGKRTIMRSWLLDGILILRLWH